MDDRKRAKLSKSILEMKFMKKTKERVEKEEEDAEGQAMYSKEITEKMRNSGHLIFIESNISQCKDLLDGRLSFGGMNPEIEKLMSNDYVKKFEASEKSKEKDVSDVEMAKGYSTVVDTMNNKFKSKNQRNKKKFMKPPEMMCN